MVIRRTMGRGRAITVLCALAVMAMPANIAPAIAQTAPGALSEAQDVNGAAGVVAEIVQCKREGGVLSIRMRLRNTGSADVKMLIVNDNFDQYYVTAGNKKYFVLRDSEKTPLANAAHNSYGAFSLETTIPKGGSFLWYAKYPAPPDEVKKINYYTPLTVPFEDIPVSE